MAEYIQTILNAFSSLDIESLRFHIKDYHYQDTTKTVFLRALEKVFVNFKHAKDTALIIYEGKCSGKSCPNFGKRGYRFVGNYSKRYLDLIFETEGDDILDIYNCAKFKSNEKVNKHQFKLEVKIQEDEKLSFIKTMEYLAKLNAATIAWNEIVNTPPRFVNFEELCYWVDKHSVAYEMFEDKEPFDFPMKWSPFLLIYPELYRFKEYLLQNIKKIREANTGINFIQTEEYLLEWLVKYEDMGTSAPFGMKFNFFKKEGDYFRWNYQNPIHFKDDIFSEAIHFASYYQKQHAKMLEKYTTYTSEEASNLYNTCDSKDDTIDLYSLHFHLENRKNLEAMGVKVPLFINNPSG
jgi:hypothetical protein